MSQEKQLETIPVGTLGLIPLSSCTLIGKKVDEYLVNWRKERNHTLTETIHYSDYSRDSFIVSAKTPRFGSGEAKA